MRGCEEFEVALERRRLQALKPDEQSPLDNHLALDQA